MPTRLIRPLRTWREMSRDEQIQLRNIVAVVIPFVILAVAAVGVLLATFTQPLRIEAPFVFSQPIYYPEKADVCPGDSLTWPVAFSVRRAPVMVISVRSIWDVQKNQTVTLPPGSNFNAGSLNFTNYTEITDVERTATVVIPQLDPGQYQIRSAVQEFNSQAAAYSVPFTVPAGCPALPEVKP